MYIGPFTIIYNNIGLFQPVRPPWLTHWYINRQVVNGYFVSAVSQMQWRH